MTDSGTLARDWITVWQSEMAAIAVDREVQETWRVLLAHWARSAAALVPTSSGGADSTRHDHPPGRARPESASRPPPPAAAPEPRDAEIARLGERIAQLETRLAELERGRDRSSHPRRAGKRRP